MVSKYYYPAQLLTARERESDHNKYYFEIILDEILI